MEKFRLIITIVLSILACTVIKAQVSGRVVDEQGEAFPYANVVLLDADSAFVSGTVSDDDGTFALAGNGTIIKVSSVGYTTVFLNCTAGGEITITMTPDAVVLNEVVVKSDLPKTHLKGDAMVTRIEGTILEKEGTASDVLKRLPAVKDVDDSKVEIFGRGNADIYVNGRRVYDNNELAQIPSDQIESVEIVTNPGARYAASTKAVVRIKTKRATGEGFGFREQFKLNNFWGFGTANQLDVNYRQGGLDIGAMLLGHIQNGGNSALEIMEILVGDQRMVQTIDKMKEDNNMRRLGTRLQVNYMFNKDHSIGARYEYNRTPRCQLHVTFPSTFTLDNELMRKSLSDIESRLPSYGHTANLYYSGNLNGWKLDANLDGVWNDSRQDNITHEGIISGNDGQPSQVVTTNNHRKGRMYAAKVTLEHTLWGGSLCVGSEYTKTWRKETALNPEHVIPEGDSKVDERLWAGFAEYSHTFLSKLTVQAGLRYEHVDGNYYEWDIHKMNKLYNDWFPSVSLSMPVGKVQLSAHYGMDVARPQFGEMSDNLFYANQYSIQSGNAKLNPCYTRVFSLNAAWRWLGANINFERVDGQIEMESIAYSEDDPMVTLIHPENMPLFHRQSINAWASPTLFNIWHPTWSVMLQLQDLERMTPDGSMRKMNHPFCYLSWQNEIDLPHDWHIKIDMNTQLKGDYATYHYSTVGFGLNMGVRRSFFNDRLDANLAIYDLTCSSQGTVTICSYRDLTLKQVCHTLGEITFTYKFNVGRDKYKGSCAGEKQKSRL